MDKADKKATEKFVKAVLNGKDVEADEELNKLIQRRAAARIAKILKN